MAKAATLISSSAKGKNKIKKSWGNCGRLSSKVNKDKDIIQI